MQAYVHDANGNLIQKCAGGSVTRSAASCSGARNNTGQTTILKKSALAGRRRRRVQT